jgi:ubiquitin C-terminal hydrolase
MENKYTGLTNIGNSCYMNSALQLLVNCRVITKIILNNPFVNNDVLVYKKFLLDYHNNRTIAPNIMRSLAAKKNEQFNGMGQNDAHEYLITVMDILEEGFKKEYEINKARYNNYNITICNIPINELMDKIFNIKLVSILICPMCKNKSENITNEKILSLSIPKNNNTNIIKLEDCFNNLFQSENLTDENKWKCDKCNNMVQATKKYRIDNVSKYFFIHLKRFSNSNNSLFKIEDGVVIPNEINIQDKKYKLRGFVLHNGSISGGHYMSYINDEKRDEWICLNNGSISVYPKDYINSIISKAYILLYVR